MISKISILIETHSDYSKLLDEYGLDTDSRGIYKWWELDTQLFNIQIKNILCKFKKLSKRL